METSFNSLSSGAKKLQLWKSLGKYLLIDEFDRFHTDPSGSYWETSAKASGSSSDGADTALIDQYNRVRHCPS